MNLLITGAWRDAKEHLNEIENLGHSVAFMQYEKDEVPCDKDWVEGIICNDLFSHHDIDDFTNLKYIQLTSAGTDRVPMEYIKEHGIKIHNAAGVYSIPMAEFAIGAVLQFYKGFRAFDDNKKSHKWEKNRNLLELTDKNVCIIGCGSVGLECAKRFKAFGCKVIGIARTAREQMYFDKIYAGSEIDKVLNTVDVVILAVSLNDDTRNLMNKGRLESLKENCILVNIARGAVVDHKALTELLEDNKIYAALDAFDNEPLSEDSKLWEMNNVIITPHNSFVGNKNQERLKQVIMKKISKFGEFIYE